MQPNRDVKTEDELVAKYEKRVKEGTAKVTAAAADIARARSAFAVKLPDGISPEAERQYEQYHALAMRIFAAYDRDMAEIQSACKRLALVVKKSH